MNIKYVFLCVVFYLATVMCEEKIFTPKELEKFNGEDKSLPIYMAIKGLVYDVSSGRDFYGKGGSYNVFAGKDCTRAVAKWTKNLEDMRPELDGLTKKELDNLEQAVNMVYKPKYPVIGKMSYYKANDKEL